MAEDNKSANAWYLDAKRYLDQFPVRTAEEERDYAAEWMGTARSYQAALNDALRQLETANKDVRALLAKLEVYRQAAGRQGPELQAPAGDCLTWYSSRTSSTNPRSLPP